MAERKLLSSQTALLNDSDSSVADVPIPLSFPALLRNPGIPTRFAHLNVSQDRKQTPVKNTKRLDKEGKRWIRRNDNAHFVGNPHVVLASKNDYFPQRPPIRTTFPEPLPAYLSRNTKVPATVLPIRDPNSANAGRFSLSLKGMRRELRKSGVAHSLVRDIEGEIITWLRDGGTLLSPDSADANVLNFPGTSVGNSDIIQEVSRTPLRLVWSIADDAFARYVIHCCARYHEIVSFSKDVSGRRLTYLLRPNTALPDFQAPASLCTPPVTDLEYSSQPDTESDTFSLEAGDSDVEPAHPPSLSVISEHSSSQSSQCSPVIFPHHVNENARSVDGDACADGYKTGTDGGMVESMASLSLEADPDRTISSEPCVRQTSMRVRMWDHSRARSASSPSRSPVRRTRPRRRHTVRVNPPRARKLPRSFYDYLFS